LGVFAGEWRVAPPRARARMRLAVVFITAAMVTLGFGSLLH
jgi:hypothetical protein